MPSLYMHVIPDLGNSPTPHNIKSRALLYVPHMKRKKRKIKSATQSQVGNIAIPHREAKNPDARLIAAQEAGRAEAAAVLERRMAAMEAVMAARRSAPPVIPDPVKDIMEQMKPSTMSRTAGGPGCGNGHEILFQVNGCGRFHVTYCSFLVKPGS